MNKKIKKKSERKCYICGEENYSLLDVHRIKWGASYSHANTVVLCTTCHRKVHCLPAQIIIHGWKMSTKGRVLHYVEDQIEKFK